MEKLTEHDWLRENVIKQFFYFQTWENIRK